MGPKTPFTNHLIEIFEKEAREAEAKINRIRDEHAHPGLKGDEAEDAVKEFLRKYLPRRYGLAKGEVIDSKGGRSKEVDIAICNEFHPFTYEKKGRGVLFIEGVSGCIEVKSKLNRSHLESAIQNCQSVRNLNPTPPKGTERYSNEYGIDRFEMTPYAVFAFDTDYEVSGIPDKIQNLNKEMGIEEENTIDMVYLLDSNLIVNFRQHQMRGGDWFHGYTVQPAEPGLLMFLLYLYRMMPVITRMPNFLDSYFRPHEY